MNRFAVALSRILITPVLLFLTVALVATIPELPASLDRQSVVLPAAVGFVVGLALFLVRPRFLLAYVVGHEFTHWLAAKCFGRQTGQLRIGPEGGSVAVEQPNLWIVLAPYFVPLYTLIWIGFYGVYCFWQRSPPALAVQVFYAGVGLTYAFHVLLTAHVMFREQQDLRTYGRFFSSVVVLCCNVSLVFLGVVFAGWQWYEGLTKLWEHVDMQWQWLVLAWEWLRSQTPF